jgi:hypothetical protein
MGKNIAKIDTDLVDLVQLINESEASIELGEAFAAFMLNPTVVWAKFILTDDRKNANGQRIPKEEFDNLMRSGIHMPVKMAMGEINRGHDDSKPLGVITHLKQITLPGGANAVMALAALWGEERPSDVTYIRDRFKNGEAVNVSWEILFGEKSFNKDTDSIDLRDTVLRAATIVGEPAYTGRTQFLAVAAKKWGKAYIESLPDSSFLYVDGEKRFIPIMDEKGIVDRTKLKEALEELGSLNLPTSILKEKKAIVLKMIERFEAGASIDEISREFNPDLKQNLEDTLNMNVEELQAKLAEVQAKLTTALEAASVKETAIAEKETALTSKDAEIAGLQERITVLESELTPLKEFKASIDAEKEKEVKLESIKTKFKDANIEKAEEYFKDNANTLIALDETSLDFMIQELKAFAEENEASASVNGKKKKTEIPAITGGEHGEVSVKDMAAYLRQSRATKN